VSHQDFLFQNCHPPPAPSIPPVSSPSCEWHLPQLHLCSTEESYSEFLLAFHKHYPNANGALTQCTAYSSELALCCLSLLLGGPGTASVFLPLGKPSALGQSPAASRQGALSSSKISPLLCGATPELSFLSVFQKPAYSQNPSSPVRLSAGLRKHEYCRFIADLL